ncbi:MAG: AAA family ATPase [Candidatus Woesearchaeota archaeon]
MADNKDAEKIMYAYTSDDNNVLEDENRILRDTITRLKNELDRYREPALMVCEVSEVVKDKAIIKVPNGNMFYVNLSSNLKNIKAGDMVLCEQKNLTVIDKIHTSKTFNVERFVIMEKPTLKWSDIGGLDEQAEEIKEVIELPLKKPELFEKVGIQPPKGILLYGPPGTGKTILAKAVASSTNSTFIEIVGSELVQKFIGEGAKMVKDIFDLARSKKPTIIFIDEIDALAAKRIEIGTSGEREVQRTFMQFLAEIDGFKNLDNVKVIGCTNRKDILDPAILRPGRLDRLIHVPTPNEEGRKEIFKIHTRNMSLKKGLKTDNIIKKMEGFSGAEIKAACTEAGYFAIRKNKKIISEDFFIDAIKKVKRKEEEEGSDYMNMFG